MRNPLTGTRIRDKRLDAGLRQADLAQTVGISPSYLNLIEHNKRRIGGKLLGDLARALHVEPAALTTGADLALVDQLRTAAADSDVKRAEVDRIEDFITRYPGWAAVMDHQCKRIAQLQTQVQTLTDRMTHDPKLAGALHDVISAVTSIRSTAAILVDDDRIDRDWQQRFHRNIHDESVRLAAESESLISYLEAPSVKTPTSVSVVEDMAGFLAQSGFAIPDLDHDPATPIAQLIDTAKQQLDAAHLSDAGRSLLATWLAGYAKRATDMPVDDFAAYAKSCDHDPLALSQHFGVSFDDVLHRLSSLDPKSGHPPTGLVTCDPAGVVTFFKPVAGFGLPRQGAACPLWPLYQAFGQPSQPIKTTVVLPDAAQTRLQCYAVAHAIPTLSFDAAPVLTATMLVIPDPPESDRPPRPVGVTCRICPRNGCAARREPSVA